MNKSSNTKLYNLEQRTLQFALDVRCYVNKLPKTIPNVEDSKQVTRSSGSIGANYIEANESLSKKDFIMRMKISRKEAKETKYWLILTSPNTDQDEQKNILIQECIEILKILSSILNKSL